MSGVTKHIYNRKIHDVEVEWNKEINSIVPLLPRIYEETTIVNLIKEYYYYEWISVCHMYSYYQEKDKFLLKFKGRSRYNMPKPLVMLKSLASFKNLFKKSFQLNHFYRYSQFKCELAADKLHQIRDPKILRTKKKIEIAKLKTQLVTPAFLDQLIGLYSRKNTTQKEKVYILLELKKYYCDKVIKFFFKLNDTEINYQLRHEAFLYLQSFNYNPRLRRQSYMIVHAKNKERREFLKNIYSREEFIIPLNPNELEYRIRFSLDQKLKIFDYFICHSSKDSKYVQELITQLNKKRKNVFCDWISDVDYLKRHLLCEATLRVIEFRLEHSSALIFVSSENSYNSVWCKYELNYFLDLNKPIYKIDVEAIKINMFKLWLEQDFWFKDPLYKQRALIASETVLDRADPECQLKVN